MAIPDRHETPGFYLVEAAVYWGALQGAFDACQCKAIAEIEGFSLDEAKDLRFLSQALLDGYLRGQDPLGIPPPFEEMQHV